MPPNANPSAHIPPEPNETTTFPSRIIDALFRWRGYDSPMTHKEAVDYLCSIAQATRNRTHEVYNPERDPIFVIAVKGVSSKGKSDVRARFDQSLSAAMTRKGPSRHATDMAFNHIIRYYRDDNGKINFLVGNECRSILSRPKKFMFVRPKLKLVYEKKRWLLELDRETGVPLGEMNDQPIFMPGYLTSDVESSRIIAKVPKKLQKTAAQETSEDGDPEDKDNEAAAETHVGAFAQSQQFLGNSEGIVQPRTAFLEEMQQKVHDQETHIQKMELEKIAQREVLEHGEQQYNVLSQEYKALKHRYQSLNQEKDRSTAEYAGLKLRIQHLEQEKRKSAEEGAVLQTWYQNSRQEKQKHEQLAQEHAALKLRNQKLEEEIRRTAIEHAELQRNYRCLQQEHSNHEKLAQEYAVLKRKHECIREQLLEIEMRSQFLLYSIDRN